MPSRCFQHRILAEDKWPGVIGFDEPFGERLVAHFVESREPGSVVAPARLNVPAVAGLPPEDDAAPSMNRFTWEREGAARGRQCR